MKKLILALLLTGAFYANARYLGGGGGTVSEADLATKLGTNAVTSTVTDSETEVPSGAAVNERLDSKVDTTSGTATNLTVAGELLFPASAYGTNYILGLYFDATNTTLRSTVVNE